MEVFLCQVQKDSIFLRKSRSPFCYNLLLCFSLSGQRYSTFLRKIRSPFCSNPLLCFSLSGQKDSTFLRKSRSSFCSNLLLLFSIEKTSTKCGGFLLAGAEGFEPSTKVLETHVLPLHHAPIAFATVALYENSAPFVKVYFSLSSAQYNTKTVFPIYPIVLLMIHHIYFPLGVIT